MKFLKATTTDGKTEYFNMDKILTITPINGDTVKLLMGAGLWYLVCIDQMDIININTTNDLLEVTQ